MKMFILVSVPLLIVRATFERKQNGTRFNGESLRDNPRGNVTVTLFANYGNGN